MSARNEAKLAPEIVVLFCQHSVRSDTKGEVNAGKAGGLSVRAEMMPCGGKVEVSHILKILENGTDGVEVVVCPEETCRSLAGSIRAAKKISYARRLLEEIRMGSERLGISRLAGLSGDDLIKLAANRFEALRSLGPNPMKKGSPG